MKKDILTLLDLAGDDFEKLFKRALELKERHKKGITDTFLAGKTLGLIFDKASTRTRLSFEAAMTQLGGTSIFISAKDTQIVRNEPVKDTARVLSRYLDVLVIRGRCENCARVQRVVVVELAVRLVHQHALGGGGTGEDQQAGDDQEQSDHQLAVVHPRPPWLMWPRAERARAGVTRSSFDRARQNVRPSHLP